MATQVAELARTRSAPDWGQGERRQFVPSWDWDDEVGGWVAYVEKKGPSWVWRDKWRKRHEQGFPFCPVSQEGTAASIAAKRRGYLSWWGALLDLQATLRHTLHGIEISGAMPPMTPWRGE